MKNRIILTGLLALTAVRSHGGSTNFAVTNFTWTGTAGSAFGSAGNWLMDQPTNNTAASGPPNATGGQDNVIFQGGVNNRIVDLGSTAWNVRGLEFNSTGGDNSFLFKASGLLPSSTLFGFNLRPGGVISHEVDGIFFDVPIKLLTYGGGNLDLGTTVAITAEAGPLVFSGNWSSGVAGKATIDVNGGTLVFNATGDITVGAANTAGIISSSTGTGAIVKNGTGNLYLNGTAANTWSGSTTINAGTVFAAKNDALGTSAALILNGGILDVGGFSQNVGAVTQTGGAINGSGTIYGTSFSFQSGSYGVQFAGSGAFTKTGSGAVTLTAANTYSGGTLVNGGTLRINNTSGSGTGSGAVSVNNGGVLAGNGSVSGAVAINSGGAIAPGNGPGTFTTGGQTWNGGGGASFAINRASGSAGTDPGWSLLQVNGTLALNATSANPFTIDVTSLTLGDTPGLVSDLNAGAPYDWLFVRTTGGVIGFDAADFRVTKGNFGNNPDATFTVVLENGNTELHLTYVPEPATVSLFCLGAGAALFAFRRRKA